MEGASSTQIVEEPPNMWLRIGKMGNGLLLSQFPMPLWKHCVTGSFFLPFFL